MIQIFTILLAICVGAAVGCEGEIFRSAANFGLHQGPLFAHYHNQSVSSHKPNKPKHTNQTNKQLTTNVNWRSRQQQR